MVNRLKAHIGHINPQNYAQILTLRNLLIINNATDGLIYSKFSRLSMNTTQLNIYINNI